MQGEARAELDRALERSLRGAWDGRVVAYDEARFPLASWVLERVRAHGWPVDDLTRIHEQVPLAAVYGLTKQLCADTREPGLRALVEDLVRDVIAAEGEPVHLQRYMLTEYCAARSIATDFELFELDAMKHLPTLWHAATTLRANVVMYSVFALPEAREERTRLLQAFLAAGAVVHFVNEGMRLADAADLADIEALCAFARYGG